MVSVLTAIFLLFSCNKEELFVEQTILPDDDATEVPKEETLDPEDKDDENISVVLLEDISIETFENTPVVIDLFSDGIDIPTNFILSFGDISNGTISVDDKGSSDIIKDDLITYIPNTGFSGMETFQYSVCNPLNPENCGVAMVTINVNPKLSIEDSFETELKAFPTAYGGGAMATGGRGGKVIHVTNLNNSGTGSLRDALLATGTRTIVFDVSGTINLTSRIDIPAASSNFTVAGQTAPEGGITISGKPIQLGKQDACNNSIWRYIRFRNGSYTGQSDVYDHNGLICEGGSNIIIDHCSFSFNDDQAISMDSHYGDLTDITIQRSIFSENATGIIIGYQGGYDRGNYTMVNNLFVDQGHRTPNTEATSIDIINNVYFNWQSRLSRIAESPDVNFIGNYMKKGNYTSGDAAVNKIISGSKPSIYSAYNYHSSLQTTPITNQQNLFNDFSNSSALPIGLFTSTQHKLIGVAPTILTAVEAYNNVLNDVGANKYLNADGTYAAFLDNFDEVKIRNVKNNISSNPFNKSWSLPVLPTNTRPSNYDTDKDGMPDLWEKAIFGDLARDGTGDLDGDGYTDLEEFLNGVDKQL